MFDCCIFTDVCFWKQYLHDIVCYDDFGWRASFISTATSFWDSFWPGYKKEARFWHQILLYTVSYIKYTRLVLIVIIFHVKSNGLSFTSGIIICYDRYVIHIQFVGVILF